jgi:hypothetical protein
MIQKFVKRPIEIEAIQWKGDNDLEIRMFMNQPLNIEEGEVIFRTLEGLEHASVGDWIIKGIKGEFYPCKPDVFERTYEKSKEPEQ